MTGAVIKFDNGESVIAEVVEPIGTRGPYRPDGSIVLEIEGEEYEYQRGANDDWYEINNSQDPCKIYLCR